VHTRIVFDNTKNVSAPIQIESHVGSISIADGIGKEIIIKFTSSSINNNGIFYTDSNGLEMQYRKRNWRKTWQLNVSQPVAGNYYPINTAIIINDSNYNCLTVVNDRS